MESKKKGEKIEDWEFLGSASQETRLEAEKF
jgi:hypothetical protein